MEIKHESVNWYGNLDDDCCAKWWSPHRWRLLLRAEWLNGEGSEAIWWWAVYNMETGQQLDSSENKPRIATGAEARKYAEASARRSIEAMYSSLFLHLFKWDASHR